MARQIALLRGINLGSHNRVPMPRLRELLGELGYEDVETVVQSGNIVLSSSLKPADLERAWAEAAACDLFVAIGTTLTVYPVAALPEIASRAGARVVTVNGEPTDFDDRADAVLRGPIAELVPRIFGVDPLP